MAINVGDYIPADWKTTADIKVPEKLIDQVIGQEKAVEIIKKAALQKRNVLLIGLPGTGKSLLAQAMAELLPVTELEDFLVYPNPKDPNNPIIKTVPAGKGKQIIEKLRAEIESEKHNASLISFAIPLVWFVVTWLIWQWKWISDVIYAATLLIGAFLFFAAGLSMQVQKKTYEQLPKLLIDNSNRKTAPFVDATGARAGALLGDVRHDPLQSGGLGTPPHLRVEPGAIFKAHKGVLFIDEISQLSIKSQQELLTAMQEKKYSITGQSELSSGSMVRTTPAPCDFILVASGNYEDLQRVHPALRSRIRGYGYEVYMQTDMPDTEENRQKLVLFVAQEVKKDGKIPHFTKEAVMEIINEARRRANKKKRLTLQLRDLGGLVRAAGDIAKLKGKKYVELQDVLEAKASALTLEQQIAEKYIEDKKLYKVYLTEGYAIGRVNGLAVIANAAGIVLPIEAQLAKSMAKSSGKIIATGKLGTIAKEAVENVSALIKNISGKDLSKMDIHIQFLQTYEGVEGDSASISVATAIISALEKIPVKQSIAMTGSLSILGEVLPVGGINAKIKAALQAGFKEVIIPKQNLEEVALSEEELKKIKIIAVENLADVLQHAFKKTKKSLRIVKLLRKTIASYLLASKKRSPLATTVQTSVS